MAIVKTTETEQELNLKVDNGDLAAIKDIKGKWNFKDKESVLRFALAILAKATSSNKKVYIDENDKKTALVPGDALLNKEEDNSTS
ncbi:MAG: hypothetical protein ACREHC_00260 [Candidatus Levyibacteriota bacterium]